MASGWEMIAGPVMRSPGAERGAAVERHVSDSRGDVHGMARSRLGAGAGRQLGARRHAAGGVDAQSRDDNADGGSKPLPGATALPWLLDKLTTIVGIGSPKA